MANGITGPFEISINTLTSGNAYVGWTLSPSTIRVTNSPQSDLNVVLQNLDASRGGQVIFRSAFGAADQDTLPLTLPSDGSPVDFFIGGKFGSPSTDDQDGGISVADAAGNAVLHQRSLMVRVRKNANTLTAGERDRFLQAYVQLNASSAAYQVFLDSHNAAADSEIHQRPAFLPWHRAFVLDLERQLQAIDPSICLPYWRFDQPAPNLFTTDFMGGTPNSAGRVALSPSNPLRNWTISGVTGVVRTPSFDTTLSAAAYSDGSGGLTPVLDEAGTLALGADFANFRNMEGDPHGMAHVSFDNGPINSPPTAPQDPLFFLLHCNVDRLWAKWQLARGLWDSPNTDTYSPQSGGRIGDNPGDTMWPWNGVTGSGRPPTAPGGPLPQLNFPSKPPPQVTVADVIDYIGRTQGNSNFFDYDDVPFA